MLTAALTFGLMLVTAAIQQELQRAQATPTCLDSGELPDLQSLVDRMAGVAYSTSLTAGVNGEVAALMSVALDVRTRFRIQRMIRIIDTQCLFYRCT